MDIDKKIEDLEAQALALAETVKDKTSIPADEYATVKAQIKALTDEAEEAKAEKRLQKLDYGRLLAEVDKAREAAKERAEQLRQRQEQQELRRGRRPGT